MYNISTPIFIYLFSEKPAEKCKPSNTIDKWYGNDKNITAPAKTTALIPTRPSSSVPTSSASATEAQFKIVDDVFACDSMSDDDLVFAADSIEEKYTTRTSETETKPNVVFFPGQGHVLGTLPTGGSKGSTGGAVVGPIVRRLPGFGVVESRSMSQPDNKNVASKRSPTKLQPFNGYDAAAAATTALMNKTSKRDPKTACLCDLSDSDDGFDRMLASRKSKRTISASDYKTKVFGNGVAMRGSIVRVKNLKSVSSPKVTPKPGCKDPRLKEDKVLVANDVRPRKKPRINETVVSLKNGNGISREIPRTSRGNEYVATQSISIDLHSDDVDTCIFANSNGKPTESLSSQNRFDSLPHTIMSNSAQIGTGSALQSPQLVDADEQNGAVVNCPVCLLAVDSHLINAHLDQCLA